MIINYFKSNEIDISYRTSLGFVENNVFKGYSYFLGSHKKMGS